MARLIVPASSPFVGHLSLNACTILWGTQHAIIKGLVAATPNPVLINALRFSAAAVLTSGVTAVSHYCLAICSAADGDSRSAPATNTRSGWCGLFLGAAELAVWQTLGFTLQTIGLQFTTASRSAFLLYLNATFVPVVATLLGEQGIGLRTWLAVFIAVAGTLLLVNDGGSPNVGDLWSVGAAMASAMFIVRLSRVGRSRDPAQLSAVTQFCTSLGCWTLATLASAHAGLDVWAQAANLVREHWARLAYLSVVVSAIASWLQAMGQQSVPPSEAAVIYCLDPVWGAFFAWVLLGETLHMLGWVGVTLVVLANLIRRLPWAEWRRVQRLVTPAPSEVNLSGMDSKRTPLLGTPQTPAWLQQWMIRFTTTHGERGCG